MIVHGAMPSPFARKVLFTLAEKGIPHEQRNLIPMPKTPELLAMHPMGKTPILELDDGTFIPDSSVICAYLERAYPEPSIYPKDAKEYARALFLEEYADSKVVEAVSTVFFERFVKPNVLQQEPDEALVKEALTTTLPPVCDYLEGQMPEKGATILPDFSIADIALGAHLGGLRFAKEEIDGERWPRLASYVSGILTRPAFQKVLSR